MRISDAIVEKLLADYGTPMEQITSLREEGIRSRRSLQSLVIQNKLMDEATLTKTYANYAGIPFIAIDPKAILQETLTKIPERIARQYNAVLFKVDEDGLMHLAMDDPDDVQAFNFIQKQIGENIKLYIATRSNILDCLENYRGDVTKELNQVIDVQREDAGESQIVSEADVAENS